MTSYSTSLVHILLRRAINQPHQLAYRFLNDGESDEVLITYNELDNRVRSIGALLQSNSREGDRALLLYPPGPDFIYAYFGCMYAKILAVPVYPPHPARPERALSIIQGIIADAKPTVALLSSSLYNALTSKGDLDPLFRNIKFLVTDNDEIQTWSGHWKQPEIHGDDIAFLQYTSGSTTKPKGVQVSHHNLSHNMDLIGKCFGISKESHGVIWLPPYHDMGLIGGILQPLYSGISVTLLPHMQFLQRPFRWLSAISRFRGTISGGPNFAYSLCVSKVKPEQRAQLDLSHWEVAFNGAEPVYHKTLEQFADFFAPCGFKRKAFLPCYGFAESTLMVTGGPRDKTPLMKNLMNSGLMKNQVLISEEQNDETRRLVSCGINMSDQKIRIVNVDKHTPCPEKEIGEIWVSGDSVTGGYWNNPEETSSTYSVPLPGSNEGPFVRSGDLGFFCDGELYITGRIKNLIISGGKNHYPHDIERTVESAHSVIRQTGCAVFSVTNAESEDIIVVAEISRRHGVNTEEVSTEISSAVSIHHGLQVHDVRLILPGGIPRTTSGKIRHFLCKKKYLEGNLKQFYLI